MAKKEQILPLRIDTKLKAKLSKISAQSNKSMSEYVRRLIEDAVSKNKIV